ncbi:ParB/RepB/Spo0J family partition protein [uncultured Sulfitobacter sp.]|uniref:ParB/RepB/Spo0J family partition protein n=1 Tax=uncultured Sulfitobacter sp. TaxID=191468 RepID=UPI0026130C9F|nr:ParB/RepB/Spo0J family partition protein [uncultured Sulfitobacter sp.]
MNDQSQITAHVQDVPFADLHLSDLNPRTVVSEASILTLADNISAYGLIQNIAGFTEENGIGVVVGGRRFRALAFLQDDPRFQTVSVKMAPDLETAQFWATSENAQREALHPADEIRDFGAMEKRGATVADIAVAYGATEAHVYRRLALANLPDPVIDALRSGEISLSNAAAFTISDDEKLTLEILENVRGQGESDHRIKKMLKPDAVKDSDRRAVFVGIEAYKAAGGRTGSDLFAEEVLIDDPAILDALFGTKLEEAAATLQAEGWKWAEAIGDSYIGWYQIEEMKLSRIYAEGGALSDDQSETYDTLSDQAEQEVLNDDGYAQLAALQDILDGSFTEDQKAHAGVLVYIDTHGAVQVEAGLVKGTDKKAAIDVGVLEKSNHVGSTATKSPISQKLAMDLGRIATGARQDAALRDPELLLALFAFQLSGKSGYTSAFGLRKDDVPKVPSTEMSGYTLDERLTKPTPSAKYGSDMARVFRAYKAKGPEFVMEEIIRHLASLLTVDAELAEVIDKAVETNIRDNFTPNAENFFGRVGGPYLIQQWRDLLDLKEDHPTVTTFAKLKKSEKADKMAALFGNDDAQEARGLTEAQVARIAAWVPEGMS